MKIAFYKTDAEDSTPLDKIIGLVTHGNYSHVEIITETDEGVYMTSISPTSGVVRTKPHIYNDSYTYIDISHKHITHKDVLRYLELAKGSKYDYVGILGFILPIRDRSDKFFCSELVTEALRLAGYYKLWMMDSSRISPSGLYEILSKDNYEK